MSDAVLSLGANVGDRQGFLTAAVEQLADTVRAVSSIYRTPPWGGVQQQDFFNVVVLVADPAIENPRVWLDRCQALERSAGRERTVRWGPRTLDADIVTVGEQVVEDPELTLPHPLAYQRAFVLLPWAEIDPFAELVGYGPIADLLERLDLTGIEKLGPLP